VNWIEFLIAGVILILIFFLILFGLLDFTINRYLSRACEVACKEVKNKNFYFYSALSCKCCELVNGSLECESVWKK
jgi:hypothetical protein